MLFYCAQKMRVKSDVLSVNNIDNMSDFMCVKLSALEKASRIAEIEEMNRTMIRFQSMLNKDNFEKSENDENEQNSCNIKTSPKTSISKQNMVFTLNGIHFSHKKILLESELQRKEEVRKKIDHHVQQMKETEHAIQEQLANSRFTMARERERRSAEALANIIAEQEQLAEQEEIKRRHEQQLHAQRDQEQKEKLEREMEEYRRRMKEKEKEKEELMKTVIAHRSQFMAKYCDIVALSKTCKDKHAHNVILTTNVPRIKELIQQIEILDKKITSGELVATDVSSTELLVHQMDDILNIFRTIEKINAEYEAELIRKAQVLNEVQPIVEAENVPIGNVVSSQQTDENNAAENKEDKEQSSNMMTNQEVVAPINAPVPLSISNSQPEEVVKNSECKKGNIYDYVDEESVHIYIKNLQFLDLYKDVHKDFLQSYDTKKFRFECQKAINIPVNAISSLSEQHLRDKYDKLQNFLTGKSSPNVMQHPQGISFCKDYLAEKIVSQGETLLSSKPDLSFPVAKIVVALWNEHPDFGELFLAHLHKTCPFTVPVLLPRQEGQSNEDYYKSLGYKYSEDGIVESQDKYLKRMSGLMRLYASITVTAQVKGVTKAHPHGLQHAWRWLAVILNFEPRADTCDICATLLLDMIEVAGNVLWITYPTQFHKLLMLLMEQYYPHMRNVASGSGGGSLMRLEEFLSNALANGNIRPADGMLPPNFL